MRYARINRMLELFALVAIIVSLIAMIVLTLISIYPFKVIDVKSPFKVLTPTVVAGGSVIFEQVAIKYMQLPADISCYFEDGVMYRVPTEYSDMPIGNMDHIIQVQVPETLPPSRYQYHCIIGYKLGYFRVLRYEYYTEGFDVVEV